MTVSGTLDADQRRRRIADLLGSEGALRLNETAESLGVHPMTVRRDFEVFVTRGLARRVRGGVIAIEGDDFEHRRYVNATAKQQIAAKLQRFVLPGQVLGLDSSTTVGAFAESLTAPTTPPGLTVITNGLRAHRALHARPGVTAYLTGGFQEDQNESLVGAVAEAALGMFAIDTAILSTMSIDRRFGTSETTMEQASFTRVLAGSAERVVLAVDSSKLGTKARFRSLDLSDHDVLVTELDPADSRLDPYRGDVEII